MSLESQFEREVECLENDLANGAISLSEYNKAVRELERDMREYEQECNCNDH